MFGHRYECIVVSGVQAMQIKAANSIDVTIVLLGPFWDYRLSAFSRGHQGF